MKSLDTKERLIWLACGILLLAWAVAAAANFGLRNYWNFFPTAGADLTRQYSSLLLATALVVTGVVLAGLLYYFGVSELRKKADMERRFRYAMEEVYRGTLHALTSALDMRDGETYGHSRRVTGYSLAIAQRLQLDSGQLQTLAWGALLHDLGKIGIRDQILLKPGPLTWEERAEMNEHVVIGQQMVQHIAFLANAITVIRHHHERYDGSGYPDQLQGDDIPLLARIFSVADAFDAMTSPRPYRPAPMTMAEAVQVIQSEQGKQFCPKVVQMFAAIPISELEKIRAASSLPMDDFSALIRLDEQDMSNTPGYYQDVLTRNQNRAAWEAKRAHMAPMRGRELGTLVFLDMDRLKQVNDTHGHLTGDRLLADLGARLQQIQAEVYRIGGDEFVLWVAPGQWKATVEQQLVTTLHHFSEYWAHILPQASVSWGVSTATDQSTGLTELLEEADKAMYTRKAEKH